MHLLQLVICLVMLLPVQSVLAVTDIESVSELPDYSVGYDPERNPFDDGRSALALAKDTDRLVMIEVGGDWCRWCLVLDDFIRANPAVYEKLYRNFVLLKVNTSDENQNAEFLAGLPATNGYPHVFISRGDGGLFGSTDTTRLIDKGHYDAQRFLAFLDRWIELGAAQRLSSNLPRTQ